MLKMERKTGAITVEVGIGIALTIVVLFVAIGLFNENLSGMISSSGFANMFSNQNKTTYSSFNRDYTAADSQLNVQLIGEQGLAMLRNIANNKAIEQIDKYMDGVDTSVINVNSIAYLAMAINAIVGSPDICVYMTKDSDKKCDQDGIGGYSYRIHLNGGSISINPEGTAGSRNPSIGGAFSDGASGITIRAYVGTTLQTFQPASMLPTIYNPAAIGKTPIYTYIKELSAFADDSNTVYDPIILIKAANAGISTAMTPTQVKTALIGFLTGSTDLSNPTGSEGIVGNMQEAHNICTGYNPFDSTDDLNIPRADGPYTDEQCGIPLNPWSEHFVYLDDTAQTQTYANTFATIVSSDPSGNVLVIVNNLLSQTDLRNFINLLRQDHINDSCGQFTRALQGIASANSVSIPIPACVPY